MDPSGRAGKQPGIEADFDLSGERLAYTVRPELSECDYPEIYAEPPPCVIEAMTGNRSIAELKAKAPSDLI